MPKHSHMEAGHRPKIRLFTTGGTIASRRDPKTGAVAAAATGEELLARVPEIGSLAEIDVEAVATVNGWNMTPSLMMDLARRVGAALDGGGLDGVVVTHGTDTVEETAFLLDLVVESSKPVAFAVALRHLDELGSDGPRNLRDAVLVAAEPASRHRGALLVANQAIHAARFVTKVHTTHPNAFGSPGHGPIGFLDDLDVHYGRPPLPRFPIRTGRVEERVLQVTASGGQDGALLAWGVESGYRGFVIEGTGAGNVPAAMLPGIEAAMAAGLPVVLCSRVPEGPLATAYGGGVAARGGGLDLARLGLIPAPGLPGHKARVLLMAALGSSRDMNVIREVFHSWSTHETEFRSLAAP